MRLLHVLHSLNPRAGGVAEAARQMTVAQRAFGAEAEVATLDVPDAPWLEPLRAQFPITALGERPGDFGYTPRLRPWLRAQRQQCDFVIAHGLWQYTTLGTWWALRKTATPYAVFPHGMLDPWFRRAYPLKHFKKALYWRCCEHRVLRDARAVIFTAEEERTLARKTFSPYHCREEVVPLGLAGPPEEAARQRQAFLARHPVFAGRRLLLFLGRLHDKKGCGELIEAFADFLAGGAGRDWHLIMAGPPSDEGYLATLQQQVAARGLGDSVSFPGMLEGELKWGAFRAAEAFILPSHQENFGMAVVEAMACGLPVLVSRKVNIWREIVDAGAGLSDEDSEAGALGLLRQWQALTPEARTVMGERAKVCFAQRFEAGEAARKLLALLETLRHA